MICYLSACEQVNRDSETGKMVDEQEYTGIKCLDGIQYWYHSVGHSAFLAVRIDPETLKPVRCD